MKGLGEDILTELRKRDPPPTSDNAPVRVRDLKHRTARDIWSEMGSLLHPYGVSVLIIDEVHNILVRGAAKDYETTAAAIKSLVIDDALADDVVLAGTKAKRAGSSRSQRNSKRAPNAWSLNPSPKARPKKFERSSLRSRLSSICRNARAWAMKIGRIASGWLRTGHRGQIAKLIYRAAEEAYKCAAASRRRLVRRRAERRYNVIDAVNPFLIAKLDNATPIPDEAWENKDDDEDDDDDDDEISLTGNGRGLK